MWYCSSGSNQYCATGSIVSTASHRFGKSAAAMMSATLNTNHTTSFGRDNPLTRDCAASFAVGGRRGIHLRIIHPHVEVPYLLA